MLLTSQMQTLIFSFMENIITNSKKIFDIRNKKEEIWKCPFGKLTILTIIYELIMENYDF